MRLTLIVTAAVAMQAAIAQTQMPACDGDITLVRVSTIKPGALPKFMAAVAAHQAWYRTNSIKDNQIVAARVFVRDEATGTFKYSDTEVVSYHFRPPMSVPNRGDAAWNAYVQQYRDSSEIKNEFMTCMPKSAR